jgi:hypothetical protein
MKAYMARMEAMDEDDQGRMPEKFSSKRDL